VSFPRPEEEEQEWIKTYTAEEVRTLFQAAQGQQRLHIALALNAGMYGIDIGSLKRKEVDLNRIPVFPPEQETPRGEKRGTKAEKRAARRGCPLREFSGCR
jgi:hypothetical protein